MREANRHSLTAGPQAPAAPIDGLESEQQFRITTTSPRRQFVGRIERIDAQTLTLAREKGAAVTVPLDGIARIERPNGKRSRGKTALLGLLIGAAGGVGVARLDGSGCQDPPGAPPGALFGCDFATGLASLFFGTLGGGTGALAGGLWPTQRWTAVPLSSLTGTASTPP